MKNFFLFIGVIMLCLLFSCKKDSNSSQLPPVVDSFLLHPPPVLDSLQIPLTVGTWWKYQRNDSISGTDGNRPICCSLLYFDSSIEVIKVVGKSSIIDSVYEYVNTNSGRIRYDTVDVFLLEVKNITKGTIDTSYAAYYNARFRIIGKVFSIAIKVPIVEGSQYNWGANAFTEANIAKKDTTVLVGNNYINNCIYYDHWTSVGVPDTKSNFQFIFLKPHVGFVYWEILNDNFNHYAGSNTHWYIRRLIDYHIAP